MKKIIFAIFAVLLAAFAPAASVRAAIINPAATISTPAVPPAGAGGLINALAGPSDYGTATPATKYDLASLTVGDMRQGYVDDCYWVAVPTAIVHQFPAYLSRNYEVLPDGTVNVTYYKAGVPYKYHESPSINTWWNNPYTGYDDSNGNAAGAIMLKAAAANRTTAGTMAGLDWGLPTEAMASFGLQYRYLPNYIASIIEAFQAGDIVVVDTGSVVDARVVRLHSYDVWAVDPATMSITLRSPWGDGYEPGYSEFLTADAGWLYRNSVLVCAGSADGEAPPLPSPETGAIAFIGPAVAMLLRRRAA